MAQPEDKRPRDVGITQLLALANDGDKDALSQLIPLVYDELRTMAHRQRGISGGGDTMNTTALVHEAYERMVGTGAAYDDRRHFFRVAARVMRSVLVDHARTQKREKRGGGIKARALDEVRIAPPERPEQMLALDEALTLLNELDTRQAEVVHLRYFIGLTVPEAAEVLGLSEASVKRDWTAARAWLLDTLSEAV